MSEVVVFGSIVHDLISYTERFPRPGESVRGRHFQTGAGGKGANQAVACARLGATVTMIGNVGDDLFGPESIKSLKESGIVTDHVRISKEKQTATATITVSDDGENCIVVVLGANEEMNEQRADQVEQVIKKAKLLMGQQEIPYEANYRAFQIARKHKVKTMYNPAPGLPNSKAEILKNVDIVITNENECEFLTGMNVEDSIDRAMSGAEKLRELGPSIALITLGARGVIVADGKDKPRLVETPKVKAIDTTGAGDCFCGSLAYFMVKHPKFSIDEQVRRSAAIAAISVQKRGTQASYPWAKEIDDQKLLNE